MFKRISTRLGLITLISLIALLVVLPTIPIHIDNQILQLNTSVGGYNINLFGGKFVKDLRMFKRGLDLNGGIRIVLKADMSKIEAANRNDALESAKEVISRRVNLLGVSEPNITTSKINDEYRIDVEIPGLDDVTQAVDLIGQTAQLSFKVLKPEYPWSQDKFYEYYVNPDVWQDAGITGADMKGATVVVNQQGSLAEQNKPQIQLQFTNEGRKKFSEIAKANINKPIGIFLDQNSAPLSMPVVSPDLADGLTNDPVITGDFDFTTAKNLSIQLRAGALPVPVSILQQETIGATLGADSIHKSIYAAVVGLLLVFVFLVFRYGKLGGLAGVALIIYALIVLAIFKLIPVVLTLPGIAGFILSIGMATDANILIFERINEEVSWGRPSNIAINMGFDRAWNSIRDSNMSSLITSFILFQFGSGPIKGFALTLALGILVSLFTSIFVVRTFIHLFKVGHKDQLKVVA